MGTALSILLWLASPGVTQAQLSEMVHAWQTRLQLDEWQVEARFVPAAELKSNTLGHLRWNAVTHQATLRVLRPADYDLPPDEALTDIENTVVHELIHLHLARLPKDAARRGLEERAVTSIADALIRARAYPKNAHN